MDRLKTRADFLRAQKGVRRRAEGLTLEACPTPSATAQPERLRVGFTASRKVGGAVERNRAKRRLRAAAAALLPLYGRAGNDYVLVAKTETLRRPYADLLADLAAAIEAAHTRLAKPAPVQAATPTAHASPQKAPDDGAHAHKLHGKAR